MPDDLERQLVAFGRTLQAETGEIIISDEPVPTGSMWNGPRRWWAIGGAAACVVAVIAGITLVARPLSDTVSQPPNSQRRGQSDDAFTIAEPTTLVSSPPTAPVTGPPATTVPAATRPPLPQVLTSLPDYRTVGTVPPDVAGVFDLEASLQTLDPDVPSVATVEIRTAWLGALVEDRQTLTVVFDPVNQRDHLTLERDGEVTFEIIDDRATGRLYIRSAIGATGGKWSRETPELAGSEFFDPLRLGPVRTDNITEAFDVTGKDLVVVNAGDPPVLQYDISMPIQALAISSMEFGFGIINPLDPRWTNEVGEFRVYVTEEPGIELVAGRVALGGQKVTIEHRIEFPDSVAPIQLPDPADVIDEGA